MTCTARRIAYQPHRWGLLIQVVVLDWLLVASSVGCEINRLGVGVTFVGIGVINRDGILVEVDYILVVVVVAIGTNERWTR